MRRAPQLEFDECFDGDALDLRRWVPYYLPQWSSRARTAARYRVRDGQLHLMIEPAQEPWCPDLDGDVRVSSLQTGMFAGPLGSAVGQHRFHPNAVVREAQDNVQLYTPCRGWIEMPARAVIDRSCMVALWMIGFEDEPERSGEICVCEIFGKDAAPGQTGVGMGVHPFGDPHLRDDFSREIVPIDVREFHVYGTEWTADHVRFFIDDVPIKTVAQSPAYPMQLMLSVYAFAATTQVNELVVDHVRGYRLIA